MAWALAIAAGALAIQIAMVWPALNSRRWSFATDLSRESVIWGALSILLLVAVFQNSPEIIPVLIVAVMVHEYGHVLAYRLAGHRAPKFRLVPFGGVAMSDEAPKSQAENAYVALMGPGFSLALLIAAEMTARILAANGDLYGAHYAAFSAMLIGALNAFNLLPFYPLDGGKTLRAVAMSVGPRTARGVTVAMSAAFAAFAIATQIWFLLVFALIGALVAFRRDPADEAAPAMGVGAALLTLLTYVLVFSAHAWAATPYMLAIGYRLGLVG